MKATTRKRGDYYLPAIKLDNGTTIVHRTYSWFIGYVNRDGALHGAELDMYDMESMGCIPEHYRKA